MARLRLLQPFSLGSVELRNRVVMLPHVTMYASDGRPTERLCRYLVERARGGVGLVITESQAVHPTSAHRNCVDAFDPDAVAGWAPAVSGCHEHGARIFGQLSHFGTEAFTVHSSREQWAPSPIPNPAVGEVPKAIDRADMDEVVDGFTRSARNLLEAGFDGIELKVGHDGILRAFCSPATNQRVDGYGGSDEARMRFPLEVVSAVRAAIGPRVPLGIRLCLDEGVRGGYGLEYGLALGKAFAAAGVDYLSADMGTWTRVDLTSPPMTVPPDAALAATRRLNESVDVPVIAFGRIHDPAQAEAIIRDGTADLVGMARQLIADPEWVRKLDAGRAADIRPCVACNQECIGRVAAHLPIGCVHNPAAGHEGELGAATLTRAAARRRVVVVGGGPAGMTAAEVAAQRGHEVTLLEASERLGGQIRLAARAPEHGTWGLIADHLEQRLEHLGVDVRTGQVADREMVLALHPDTVVIATGATPAPPPFPVGEGVDVLTAWELFGDQPPRGRDVVLMDLGVRYEGAAAAEALLAYGNRVRWVAPTLVIGQEIDPGSRALLLRRIADDPVELVAGAMVLEASRDTVLLLDVLSERVRPTTGTGCVVVVGNKQAQHSLAVALEGQGPLVMRAGDAVAPRNVTTATSDGARCGRRA